MKINLKHSGEHFNLVATSGEGHSVSMDASENIGGQNKAMRPMQVLLSSLAGCTAIDVLLILKKQKQAVEGFEIEVEGLREEVKDYSLFRNILLHFKFNKNVDKDKAERAVSLSLEKYCSVAKTLEPTAKINYKLSFNHKEH